VSILFPAWQSEYTAIFYALNLDFFRTPVGDLFLALPDWVLRLMTCVVIKWEFCGPFFFCVPFKTQAFRLFACFAFFMFHLGLGLCLRLGIFSWVGAFVPMCTLPSIFWDDIVFRYFRRKQISKSSKSSTSLSESSTPILTVLYDNENQFSSLVFNTLSTFFLVPGTYQIRTAKLIKSESEQHQKVIQVKKKGKDRTNAEALLFLSRYSPLLVFFRLSMFHTSLAKRIINNLLDYGVTNFSDIVQKHEKPKRKKQLFSKRFHLYYGYVRKVVNLNNLVNLFLVVLFVSTLVHNVENVLEESIEPMWLSDFSDTLMTWTQQGQLWAMFSPEPPHDDFWATIEGIKYNGEHVELLGNEGFFTWKGRPMTFDKPYPLPNHRWFKIFEAIKVVEESDSVASSVCAYACNQWNARHKGKQKLKKINFFVVSQETFLNNTKGELEIEHYWTERCQK